MPASKMSRRSFKPEDRERIEVRLLESLQTLKPAVRMLRGYEPYGAGTDRTTNTIVIISVGKSMAEGNAPPLLALAGESVKPGVVFERPIADSETQWTIEPRRRSAPGIPVSGKSRHSAPVVLPLMWSCAFTQKCSIEGG